MTLAVDIQDAASALRADYVASGSFSAEQVSTCDYGVLDTAGACALVIQPLSSPLNWMTFSTVQARWGLRVECYIQDTLNAEEVLTRKWDMHYSAVQPIVDGTTINKADGTRTARPTGIDAPADTYVEFGGHDYIPLYVTVEVVEEG